MSKWCDIKIVSIKEKKEEEVFDWIKEVDEIKKKCKSKTTPILPQYIPSIISENLIKKSNP